MGNFFLICLKAKAPSFLFKNKAKHADPDPVTLESWQFLISLISSKIFPTAGNLEITTFSKEFFDSCNALIKSNRAALVESGDDILREMNWTEDVQRESKKQRNLFSHFTDEETQILKIIQHKGFSSKEQIAVCLNKSIQKISESLFNLELNGAIKALPGNTYQIKA